MTIKVIHVKGVGSHVIEIKDFGKSSIREQLVYFEEDGEGFGLE